MPDKGQKNFRLPPRIADRLDAFLAAYNQRGAKLKPSQVVAAGLLLLFEQPEDVQLTMLQRGRSYDLEVLRDKGTAEDADRLMDRAEAIPRVVQQGGAGKKRKRRVG